MKKTKSKKDQTLKKENIVEIKTHSSDDKEVYIPKLNDLFHVCEPESYSVEYIYLRNRLKEIEGMSRLLVLIGVSCLVLLVILLIRSWW